MTYKTSKPKNRFPVYITGEPLNLTIYRECCRGSVRFALIMLFFIRFLCGEPWLIH